MIYRVYKSLDNPASMFGIKGSYIYYVGGGAIIGVVIGTTVGMFTNGFVGFIVFLLGLAISYFGTMVFQTRFTERERKRWLSSRSIPDIVIVRPSPFRELAKQNIEQARKRAETNVKANANQT